jgi:hypothetical protein
LAASAGAELRAEKMVDFPTLGSPTIPQFNAIPGTVSENCVSVN